MFVSLGKFVCVSCVGVNAYESVSWLAVVGISDTGANKDTGAYLPGSKAQLCHELVVWPWATSFTSLSFT